MPTLDELALTHGTDKSSAGHNYCSVYEEIFGHLQHEPVKLVELGVYRGASIRLWDEFFDNPDCDIIGIDQYLAEVVDEGPSLSGRVRLYRSDQAEIPLALQGFHDLDVIIDDASHVCAKTIASFITWWPRLKSGGLYIVEDTATSYHPDYGGSPNPTSLDLRWPNPYKLTTMQWFQRLTNQVNSWAFSPKYVMGDFEVKEISFAPDLIVVTKK